MPMLVVYGLPEKGSHEELFHTLKRAVMDVAELKLGENSVSVKMPRDHVPMELGAEIIVMVECLTAKPDRTEEVRDKLASAIVKTIQSYFPDANLIECFIKPFERGQGFASSK